MSTLSDDQYLYAAHDAYASLCIWQHLVMKSTVGLPVTNFTSGVLVDICGGHRIVARGQILEQPKTVTIFRSGQLVEVNVTGTKAVVQVDEIINGSFKPSADKMTLDQLGPVPFVILVAKSMLCTRNISPPETISQENSDGLCIPNDSHSYSPPEVLLPSSDEVAQMQRQSSIAEEQEEQEEDEEEEDMPEEMEIVRPNVEDDVGFFSLSYICDLIHGNRIWRNMLTLSWTRLLQK